MIAVVVDQSVLVVGGAVDQILAGVDLDGDVAALDGERLAFAGRKSGFDGEVCPQTVPKSQGVSKNSSK